MSYSIFLFWNLFFIFVFGLIIRTVKIYDYLFNWKFLDFSVFKWGICGMFQIENFSIFLNWEFLEFPKLEIRK